MTEEQKRTPTPSTLIIAEGDDGYMTTFLFEGRYTAEEAAEKIRQDDPARGELTIAHLETVFPS